MHKVRHFAKLTTADQTWCDRLVYGSGKFQSRPGDCAAALWAAAVGTRNQGICRAGYANSEELVGNSLCRSALLDSGHREVEAAFEANDGQATRVGSVDVCAVAKTSSIMLVFLRVSACSLFTVI